MASIIVMIDADYNGREHRPLKQRLLPLIIDPDLMMDAVLMIDTAILLRHILPRAQIIIVMMNAIMVGNTVPNQGYSADNKPRFDDESSYNGQEHRHQASGAYRNGRPPFRSALDAREQYRWEQPRLNPDYYTVNGRRDFPPTLRPQVPDYYRDDRPRFDDGRRYNGRDTTSPLNPRLLYLMIDLAMMVRHPPPQGPDYYPDGFKHRYDDPAAPSNRSATPINNKDNSLVQRLSVPAAIKNRIPLSNVTTNNQKKIKNIISNYVSKLMT